MTAVYPNPAHTRTRLLGQAPQIFDCDPDEGGCGATRGNYCISSGGHQDSLVGYHAPRRRKVAGMSDDEVYAEMLTVDAERRERQVAARRPLRWRDSEIQAAQAATRTDWQATAARLGARVLIRPVLQEERDNRPPLGPISGVTDIRVARARREASRGQTPEGAA